MTRHTVRNIAGWCSLLTLALFVLVYGKSAAATVRLPLPSLSLGNISLQGVQVQPYAENPTLVIPRLNLSTPIIKDVSAIDKVQYSDALRQGVALAAGSASLEDKNGNSFIFGHSSNFTVLPTRYDSIFASLPSLQSGDQVEIVTGGRTASYTVTLSQVVNAKEVSYMGSTSERVVTLVTCWPLGTDYKRWVVQAIKNT